MPNNLGVQSGKPFAVMFKNNSFLQNLKIKISSNSSLRNIQAPDNEPLKDLMALSFVVNPKKKNSENIPKTLNETWASFRADFEKSINQSLGWMDQSTVVCNKVLESQLEQSLSQFEVTQIPNTLDRTWRYNEKGQKTYGGFEDWRREKNLPKIKAALEKTSSDKKDESVAEKTFIPESLDTTWNCN